MKNVGTAAERTAQPSASGPVDTGAERNASGGCHPDLLHNLNDKMGASLSKTSRFGVASTKNIARRLRLFSNQAREGGGRPRAGWVYDPI
jgi:hypothetical protein